MRLKYKRQNKLAYYSMKENSQGKLDIGKRVFLKYFKIKL